MSFFLKYIVALFYKKLRIKIVVRLLRESGPCTVCKATLLGRFYSVTNTVKEV